MIYFILWIGLAFLCGKMGQDRNIGFGGALVIALIFSPIIGFIVVALSDYSKEEVITVAEKERRAALAAEVVVVPATNSALDIEKQLAFMLPQTVGDDSAKLKLLENYRNRGVITVWDFDKIKTEIFPETTSSRQ